MARGILNYTTKVTVERTVTEIHKLLAGHGARAVQTEYGDGEAIGLAFTIPTKFGERAYFLPVNVDGVQAVLVAEWKRGKVERRYASREHARSVAWRIAKDWLDAQLAVVRAGLVEIEQVMLPYMETPGGKSLYEALIEQHLALPEGRP